MRVKDIRKVFKIKNNGKKAAVELSINFLVIIIIALVVFGFGIRFLYKITTEAAGLQKMSFEQLDSKIGSLLCQSSEKVCIGIDKKIIKRGDFDIFGMKVINILDEQEFNIAVSEGPAYDKEKNSIDNILKVLPQTRSVFLKRNEEKNLGVGIEVPPNSISGTYIFDVAVCYEGGESVLNDYDRCESPNPDYPDLYSYNKIYVEVP